MKKLQFWPWFDFSTFFRAIVGFSKFFPFVWTHMNRISRHLSLCKLTTSILVRNLLSDFFAGIMTDTRNYLNAFVWNQSWSSWLALRLSTMVFRVSLVKKLLYVPGVPRIQLTDTFRILILKSVHNSSGCSESSNSPKFSASSRLYSWATLSSRRHPAELGWMAPSYGTSI